jgi:hypothetical protein
MRTESERGLLDRAMPSLRRTLPDLPQSLSHPSRGGKDPSDDSIEASFGRRIAMHPGDSDLALPCGRGRMAGGISRSLGSSHPSGVIIFDGVGQRMGSC